MRKEFPYWWEEFIRFGAESMRIGRHKAAGWEIYKCLFSMVIGRFLYVDFEVMARKLQGFCSARCRFGFFEILREFKGNEDGNSISDQPEAGFSDAAYDGTSKSESAGADGQPANGGAACAVQPA
jgi:hypothetical protein